MRDIIKTVIVVLTLSFLLATGPAFAFMPADRGVSAPQTVWSDLGIKGTASGRVVTSLDQTKGVDGAYVALVNTMNPVEEYYNTTTDADGNFRLTGVNATYSSGLSRGPDGTSGSYLQGKNVYMIYANISTGEGYSSSFGVDANHTNTAIDPVVIYAGIPDNEDIVTPEPTSTEQPTAVVTPALATATPEPTPGPTGQLPTGLLLAAAVLIILAIAAVASYFLFRRKKKK
jgi:hypothetical protein